jgi:uncharacterized membrane protein
MIDLILAIKFVHVLAAAAMFGTWLAIAIFMLLAHRSHNTSVVALTSFFVVKVERWVMIAAIALQPVSGFALSTVIGVAPFDEFWLVLSLALYVVVVAAWLATLRLEIRIRNLARQAALDALRLPADYDRLFRIYSAVVWPALLGTAALFLLMVWQPRLS